MEKELLEPLLVAQVLTLAKTMEANSKTWKSDFIPDAIKEIQEKRREVLRKLSEVR